MPRYKHIQVKRVPLAEFLPVPKPRELTPRQRAKLERDNEMRAAIAEANDGPETDAVVIVPRPGQKLPTLRAAAIRLLREERVKVNCATRGESLVFSKGNIPGARSRPVRP